RHPRPTLFPYTTLFRSSLQQVGVVCETFFLASRTSSWVLAKESRRLRKTIRLFRPDLLHAHYGTVTAFFSAVMAPVPLVVTYRGDRKSTRLNSSHRTIS